MMKILIISIENDVSTDEVIDWLLYWNISFYRINEEDSVFFNLLKIGEVIRLQINNDDIDLYSFTSSVWYRRGKLNINKGYFNYRFRKTAQ